MAIKMDMKQTILLGKVLEECCFTTADGFASYKDGWDDEVVLKTITERNKTGRQFSMTSVQNMRRELYGNLKKSPAADEELLARRLAALETTFHESNRQLASRCHELELQVNALTIRVNALMRNRKPHSSPPDPDTKEGVPLL